MEQKALFDLYVDYLIGNSGEVTATGLSAVSNGVVSHDQVTRLLNSNRDEFTTPAYWKRIKPLIREVNNPEGVMIIDDFVEEKPHSKENDLIAYHYSHLQGGSVKGINIVHLLYSVAQNDERVNIPVAFELLRKTEARINPKTGKKQRFSLVNKNQMARGLLHRATHLNHIPYRYVLADSWYASAENMVYIKQKLKKDFIFGLKANRQVALSKGALRRKELVQVTNLRLEPGQAHQIWLTDVPFPLMLAKEVYVNKDQSTATLFLVTSQLDLSYQQLISLYPIRWKIEESHKSLKNNASLANSPTKVVRTQANHVFASFCALVKLEMLKLKSRVSHFAIKKVIQIQATRAAMKELDRLTATA
ncbi:MAG: transposase [Bacteroidota bacterium]